MTNPNPTGQAFLTDFGSPFTALDFHADQRQAQIFTTMPCVVTAVTPSGTGPGTGTVNVQPGINQVDGQGGTSTPHGVVNGLPYYRTQAGSWGIVCDPQVGDQGFIVTCCRDISLFKSTQAVANPGSFRKHDMADSYYMGGSLGGSLTQWVEFTTGKVAINSTAEIDMSIGGTLVAKVTSAGLSVTGTISASGQITAVVGGGDSVTLQGHDHKILNVESGSSTLTTTSPVAGT